MPTIQANGLELGYAIDGDGPETLVLPSHGRPFRSLQRRIDALAGHHHQQLDMLRDFYREPRTANRQGRSAAFVPLTMRPT